MGAGVLGSSTEEAVVPIFACPWPCRRRSWRWLGSRGWAGNRDLQSLTRVDQVRIAKSVEIRYGLPGGAIARSDQLEVLAALDNVDLGAGGLRLAVNGDSESLTRIDEVGVPKVVCVHNRLHGDTVIAGDHGQVLTGLDHMVDGLASLCLSCE